MSGVFNLTPDESGSIAGADNGIRTRDPQLGKLMLYQLSYIRITDAGEIIAQKTFSGKQNLIFPRIRGDFREMCRSKSSGAADRNRTYTLRIHNPPLCR